MHLHHTPQRLEADSQRCGQRLASRLAHARLSSGRSTEAVARSTGISVETARGIEKGRTITPEFSTVAAQAIELGLPLDELYHHSRALVAEERPSPPSQTVPDMPRPPGAGGRLACVVSGGHRVPPLRSVLASSQGRERSVQPGTGRCAGRSRAPVISQVQGQ
ncbi:helix-turn-helix domain-containing protein [Streptomyces sp. SHP 1-2]|uniref:helix-turn-helix domain-containing protein n=1 Tax=Streptomyces sp. SHP 1-2 TaxID=2769489 RepID=UPI002238B2D1|nr:helix-turn-helix domain-containing protein [Streptomyces sp. SHP 1-2]MCW5254536.1 helix-turn-helix transcriptional regulator [Streptomyces sp. SHP 1-2]